MGTSEFSEYYERNKQQFFSDWKTFLRFKSVSTDPAFDSDCKKCAEWLCEYLRSIGFETEVITTSTKPLVLARRAGDSKYPRVLYYGHYDVQPVDPIDQWKSDPFEPVERDGRLYSRGAQDNKGQTMFVLAALKTLIERNVLRCPVTLLIEGEEESGSEAISAALPSLQEKLASDILMVCDTGSLQAGVPFITMGLRGLIKLEVKVSGPNHDLHSGALGGVVKNPATELCRLLATLHNSDGSIAVQGYYEQVRQVSAQDRELANRAWIPDEQFRAMIGAYPLGGETGFKPAERRGMRPTIEINGLTSGYQGPGTKTIIPSYASAKLTSRLVPNQDPGRCLELIVNHLKKNLAPGVEMLVLDSGVGGPAIALEAASPVVQKASEVLQEISGGKVEYTWEGGSIPIVAELARVTGAAPLLVGFGLEEDHIHAPNESFALSQFRLGYLYAARLLEKLSGLP